VCFVLYNTLARDEPHVSDVSIDYTYTKTKEFYLITSDMTANAEENFVGNISKIFLNKENRYQIDINMGDIVYEEGVKNVHRLYILPLNTPKGTYCVKTIMRWKPTFSLLEKKKVFEHGCFAIND
jgi:predicted component of viral defense system (DUF524 family)